MNDDPYDYLDADYEEYLKKEEANNRQAFYIAFLLLTGIKEKAVSIDRRNLLISIGHVMTGGFNMKEKKHLLLPMDLQLFAENPNSSDTVNPETTPANDTQDKETDNPEDKEKAKTKDNGKSFTREDVAKMIAAETKRAVEQAKTQWEKEKSYEQMTAEERIKAKEKEASDKEALAEKKEQQAQARIDRLERAESVRKDLSESGLTDYVSATYADLLLVKDNDEDTKKATDAMKKIIAAAREGIQKELLKGDTVNVATATKNEANWRDNLAKNLKNKQEMNNYASYFRQ